MISFLTHKAKLNNNFTGINTEVLGKASGELKLCGLKLYLYLAGNKDGYKWTLNPTAYANWLGLDYANASTARAVRKAINDGIADLIEKGYLIAIDSNNFEFMEQKIP
jgi:hypothetical protein